MESMAKADGSVEHGRGSSVKLPISTTVIFYNCHMGTDGVLAKKKWGGGGGGGGGCRMSNLKNVYVACPCCYKK